MPPAEAAETWARLQMTIDRAISCASRRAFSQLQQAACFDALTGVMNRWSFEADLAREFGRITRHGGHFSLAMVDLDGLKTINDTLGHTVGDARLQVLGEALRTSTRREDTAYRVGGDEFAVLLPGASRIQAQRIMHRVAESAGPPSSAGAWPPARPTAPAPRPSSPPPTPASTAAGPRPDGKQVASATEPSARRAIRLDGSRSLAWSRHAPFNAPDRVRCRRSWRSPGTACGSDDKPEAATSTTIALVTTSSRDHHVHRRHHSAPASVTMAGQTVTTAKLRAIAAGLCEAAQQAATDLSAAEKTFQGKSHDGLHLIARGLQDIDRPASATLLEAKQKVEGDFSNDAAGPQVAADLRSLSEVTKSSLALFNVTVDACPTS